MIMNQEQIDRMHTGQGFIAALDQSGGSTPKALKLYGIDETAYANDQEMFALMHQMRARIMTSPAFSPEFILGAILFESTLDRQVDGVPTTDYLLKKGILPFLKVDLGLQELHDDVQLMKPITNLDALLKKAVANKAFGTKMRSVIKGANAKGIREIVAQQFDVARQIIGYGLVPIIEPEVDINIPDKSAAEAILKDELRKGLAALAAEQKVMLKLSLPTEDNFYQDLLADTHLVRLVALSGGYTQAQANEKLAQNSGVIASFSRALTEGLSASQTDEEFNQALSKSIQAIAAASR
jgi:fructose-bisphosphate aldolase class I